MKKLLLASILFSLVTSNFSLCMNNSEKHEPEQLSKKFQRLAKEHPSLAKKYLALLSKESTRQKIQKKRTQTQWSPRKICILITAIFIGSYLYLKNPLFSLCPESETSAHSIVDLVEFIITAPFEFFTWLGHVLAIHLPAVWATDGIAYRYNKCYRKHKETHKNKDKKRRAIKNAQKQRKQKFDQEQHRRNKGKKRSFNKKANRQ